MISSLMGRAGMPAWKPYGSGFCLAPDDGSGGGGGNPPAPTPAPAPSGDDRKELIAQRDKAKTINRVVSEQLAAMGIKIKAEPGEDGQLQVSLDGLDKVTTALQANEEFRRETQRRAGNWTERETELTQKHEAKLSAVQTAAQKKQAAYEKWVAQQAVDDAITKALLASDVLAGAENDLAALVKGQFTLVQEFDDETGALKIEARAMGPDGKQRFNATSGEPMSVAEVVAEALEARPHMRRTKGRQGPGAGGFVAPGVSARRVQQEMNRLDKGGPGQSLGNQDFRESAREAANAALGINAEQVRIARGRYGA